MFCASGVATSPPTVVGQRDKAKKGPVGPKTAHIRRKVATTAGIRHSEHNLSDLQCAKVTKLEEGLLGAPLVH